MDKVKAFARIAWSHNFWIGCGLILAISMGSWFVARGTLREEFEKNEGQISSKFQTVSTLISKTNPPTEKSHAKMDQLLDRTLKSVESAWLQQYSDQQRILVWDPRLRPDFISKVRPLKPIELKVDFPTPPASELDPDLLQRYANYVDNLLPILAQTIGTDWQVGRTLAMGPGGTPALPGRPTEKKPPLVVWDQSDQSRLVGTHFNWSSQPDAAPTTLQMLYAQEDLWVYTALMHIIRQTNGDIESRHEGVVKTIETILIGRSAIGKAGQITSLGGRSAGGYGGEMGGYGEEMGGYGEEMGGYGEEAGGYGEEAGGYGEEAGGYGEEMGMGMGMGMGEEGADMYSGGGMTAAASRDPGDLRYVDNNYTPLPASRLREALRSGGPEDAFLVVAKRMPVRLRLIVDQRKLPRLLAEFGNSPLPVEVRQVRVNRQGGTTGGGGYGGEMGGYGAGGYGGEMGGYGEEMGGMGGYGEEMGGYGGETGGYGGEMGGYGEEMGGYGEEMGGYGAGGYGMGGGNMNSRTSISSTSKHDVPVDIYGIIYIYNPVDKEKLGQEQAPALTGPTASPSSTPMG